MKESAEEKSLPLPAFPSAAFFLLFSLELCPSEMDKQKMKNKEAPFEPLPFSLVPLLPPARFANAGSGERDLRTKKFEL